MAILPDESVPEAHRRYAPGRGHVEQPVRQSLPVSSLAALLAPERIEPGRLVDAIARLEDQLLLRERDARQFAAWERTVRSIGTPDAEAEIEAVRTGFIDVITSPTQVTGLVPAAGQWEFSGNRPAVNPEAVTPRALASAELDTQAFEVGLVPGEIAAAQKPFEPDHRVGETGWMVHDAVLGDAASTPPSDTRLSRIAGIRGWFAARGTRRSAR